MKSSLEVNNTLIFMIKITDDLFQRVYDEFKTRIETDLSVRKRISILRLNDI